jgi:hypothetical protein
MTRISVELPYYPKKNLFSLTADFRIMPAQRFDISGRGRNERQFADAVDDKLRCNDGKEQPH